MNLMDLLQGNKEKVFGAEQGNIIAPMENLRPDYTIPPELLKQLLEKLKTMQITGGNEYEQKPWSITEKWNTQNPTLQNMYKDYLGK